MKGCFKRRKAKKSSKKETEKNGNDSSGRGSPDNKESDSPDNNANGSSVRRVSFASKVGGHMLRENSLMLSDLTEVTTPSAFGVSVDVIESILKCPKVSASLNPVQKSGLEKVYRYLNQENASMSIPGSIIDTCETSSVSAYLASEFGGISFRASGVDGANVARAVKSLRKASKANSFIRQLSNSVKERNESLPPSMYLPHEWNALSTESKMKLQSMLSWESLSKWNFDVFEISKIPGVESDEVSSTLLFLGWAIVASPHSQKAMSNSIDISKGNTSSDNESVEMSNGYNFVTKFNFSPNTLCQFLRSIAADYVRENPYHNAIHASDVLQTTHSILQLGGLAFSSGSLETYSVLLAAIIHDVGHPGKNNAYMMNTFSDLSIRYNNISILENHHLALAFSRLLGARRQRDLDILGGLNPHDHETARKIIVDSVLGTDMSRHFTSIATLKGRLDSLEKNSSAADPRSEWKGEEALFVLKFILHAADISNPAKKFFVEWADLVLEEFFAQGDAEMMHGLPVSPLCHRKTTGRAESQIGFTNFVVKPTFEQLARCIPAIRNEVLPTIEKNLSFWSAEKCKEDVEGKEVEETND
mmetsp:Transcript_28493/g.41419  ORF Transcript_28493/g.41419 Transcript_28493/m.41419 type:complete len:589 (+) Transcript_28493:95-1861(+)